MSDYINLPTAASCIAELTSRRFAAADTMSILIAGTDGRIPIYWHNATQKFSALSGFTKEVEERERAVRWMQVSSIDLARLTVQESIETSLFEPEDDDLDHLAKANSEDGYRAITETGGATVTRDQLFVRERDVRELVRKSDTSSQNASPLADGTVAVQRLVAQEAVILAVIRQMGDEPTQIPRFDYTKPGLKAKVRDSLVGVHPLFTSAGIFDDAWQRLRNKKEIVERV
jgi:hypothetical protein